MLLTRHGLWAIDLLGRGGTKVDGENVRAVPLESGNEIAVAAFRIGVFYEEPADLAAAERLTDNAAESDTSMDELESAVSAGRARFPKRPPSRPSETAATLPPRLDWRGNIFKLDAEGQTLIVIPMVEGGRFSLSAVARRGERFATQVRDDDSSRISWSI